MDLEKIRAKFRAFRESQEFKSAKEDARKGVILTGQEVGVGYLDVLGFAAMVERDADTMANTYRDAVSRIQTFTEARSLLIEKDEEHVEVVGLNKINPPAVFSDSMFIVTRDSSPEAIDQLCHVMNLTFHLMMSAGLPIRGAISTGRVWWDGDVSIRLGPGITRTYRLAESLDCIGIAIDSRLERGPLMSSPIHFPVKGGGTVLLSVPLQGVWGGIVMHPSHANEMFPKFRRKAALEGDLRVLAKYDGSMQIIDAMAADAVKT